MDADTNTKDEGAAAALFDLSIAHDICIMTCATNNGKCEISDTVHTGTM
jgi:hypothetical protein